MQLIKSVLTSSRHSVEQAHQYFLRIWLVPDCYELERILDKMAKKANLLFTAASGAGTRLVGHSFSNLQVWPMHADANWSTGVYRRVRSGGVAHEDMLPEVCMIYLYAYRPVYMYTCSGTMILVITL